MTTNTETIKVIFRADKKTGEIIAFFPELPGTIYYAQDCLSYQHVGQHGSASFNYYWINTRPATPDQYKDLLDELQELYEGRLRLANRMTRADDEKRKAAVAAS